MSNAPQLHSETGGIFSVRGQEQYVPAERMMPTEEVLPGVLAPLFILPNVDSTNWNNDHMHFEVNDPRLTGEEQRPLRYCAIQHLPLPIHNRKNQLYDAVEMPTDPDTRFQAVLLGAAGYVTHHAVDISDWHPKVVELDESDRAKIHSRKYIRMEPRTKWKVGLYIASHVLQYGLDAVRDSKEVADFLSADNEDTRRKSSFGVMRLAVQNVVEPFEPAYENARRSSSIRVPEPTATRFITRYFEEHQPDYVSTMAEELLRAA